MRPFSLPVSLQRQGPLPRVTNSTSAGHLGGVAPSNLTYGVRRDFTFTPLYLPGLTIQGGLRQPPRG